MVIHYSREEFEKIWTSKDFTNEYNKYIEINASKLTKLKNINKKNFQLSNESDEFKLLKNYLNKLSTLNIEKSKSNIINLITDDVLEKSIIYIIDKCIVEYSYIDLYVIVIKDILNKCPLDIRYIINNKIENIFNNIKKIDISDYEQLCDINKKVDQSIGISILVVHLEKNQIIEKYITTMIEKFIKSMDLSNAEISNKYISSLYNIFKLIDTEYITLYEKDLNELLTKTNCKKNKFKIMDIFDLKK